MDELRYVVITTYDSSKSFAETRDEAEVIVKEKMLNDVRGIRDFIIVER